MLQVTSIPLVPKPKIPETFSGKYGSLLIATMINANAYGFALIMVVRYFGLYSAGDPALTKGVVSLLIISATAEVLCTSHQVFDYFILKFGRSELFNGISSVALAKYLSAFFTAFVAQMFYASRIWSFDPKISDQIHALETATTYAPSYFSGNIANGDTPEHLKILKVVITQGISTAICDVAITASFSFVFYSNRSGIRSRTHSILNRFIIYAIHRAAATSVCSIVGVFTVFVTTALLIEIGITIIAVLLSLRTYIYMIPVLGNTDLHVISVVNSPQEEAKGGRLFSSSFNIEIPSIVGGSNTTYQSIIATLFGGTRSQVLLKLLNAGLANAAKSKALVLASLHNEDTFKYEDKETTLAIDRIRYGDLGWILADLGGSVRVPKEHNLLRA
ncbi:hypothetical protein BDQ17DRAFT_1335520 [Cyathus striatus]|nr:hypothetical protein BDQ17DRAFT_1335520 [Cyathus striatus]